jgi:flagellar M-ring protein FliF
VPESIRGIFSQLVAFWRALPTPKRVLLVASTVGVLALSLGLVALGGNETYVSLFGELSTADAAAIVEKLKTQQVPYRLDETGTRVQVPESRVHELRLELASAGLPRGGGVGFEIFDKSQLGSTEFEQQVNLRRALEGELGRSISTVRGVESARVHLVMPERRLFVRGQERASASVVLKLRSPEAFGRTEIAGIVHLVASAVPGLSRERVSVVSAEGVTLHRPTFDGDTTGGAADLGEHGQLVASQLEVAAREQLERVVGQGNADVRVNVAINPATREKTQELFNKDTTALRSEHKVEEMTGGREETVAGVPGAQSNLPDANPPGDNPEAATPVGAGGVFRRSQTRNWEVDRVVEKTSTPPGEIEKLSVAVLLDNKRVEKNGKTLVVPRTKEELASLEEIVRRAVGFDTTRGDSLTVRAMEFHHDSMADGVKSPEVPLWRRYLPHAAAALALLVALVVFLKRSKNERKLARVQAAAQLSAAERAAAALPDAERRARLLEPSAGALEDFRARALELAGRDPATASVVLKGWLSASASDPA